MQALATDTLVQRIIDILQASSMPDLRLRENGGPIQQYIYGRPDVNEIGDRYPLIWVESGDIGGNFYEDAGFANSTQIGHFFTATIGIMCSNAEAEQVEADSLALHDDVRLALRKDASLTGSGSALVQDIALAWSSQKTVSQPEDTTDFVAEVVIIARWLLLEDVN